MIAPSDMTGKVALVTGAAAGLGKATALKLATAGAAICLVDIDEAGLQETAKEITAKGGEALVHPTDLGDGDNCRAAVATTVGKFGRLDALCNVAAVFLPGRTGDMTDEMIDKTLAVNLGAPLKLIQAAIPHLLEHGGAVVNVTSCAAFQGQAYLAAYSATKAGLTHMTKSLAMEYMHEPIRFNAVAPGGMMTSLAMGFQNIREPDPSLLGRISPLRGMVEIDEVADMVAYLATDAASGYHGACINIDNGVAAG